MGAVEGSGLDAQQWDILHLQAWQACSLLLVLLFLLTAILVVLITRILKRWRNRTFREDLEQLGFEFEKNKYGLLDARGTYKGRKASVVHSTDIWAKPRIVTYTLEHRLEGIKGEYDLEGFKVRPGVFVREKGEWLDSSAGFLESMERKITHIEENPQLLERIEHEGDDPPRSAEEM